MITNLKIKGFRSLKELDVDLGPLTILIGPNNSGKTNFMDFFMLLSEAADGRLADGVARRGGLRNLLYADKEVEEISWDLMIERILESPTRYSVTFRESNNYPSVWSEYISQLKHPILLREKGKMSIWDNQKLKLESGWENHTELVIALVRDAINYPVFDKLRRYMNGFTYYGDFSTHLNAPIRHPFLARSETRLHPMGDNLTNVLHTLYNTPKYQPTYDELVEIVQLAYPELDRFYFPAEGGDGRIVLHWQDKHFPDRTFSTAYLADGVLRFLCLIAILLNPEPPPLICIDEPELGLHPSLLNLIAELIQFASERTQLIVATHSPQLVNYFQVSEIAVVEKAEGATTIRRLEEKEFKHWLEDFSLGDLWLMGKLGGRP